LVEKKAWKKDAILVVLMVAKMVEMMVEM